MAAKTGEFFGGDVDVRVDCNLDYGEKVFLFECECDSVKVWQIFKTEDYGMQTVLLFYIFVELKLRTQHSRPPCSGRCRSGALRRLAVNK